MMRRNQPFGKPRRAARSKSGLHAINPLRVLLFGRPIPTDRQHHARLTKLVALPVFSSDAISSVAYATQEILLVLGLAGIYVGSLAALYTQLAFGITVAIVCLLAIVATSYWQTIFAYPSGGGSYIVSKDNLGVWPGLIAASALLIDYVVTVAVSLSSGVQNLLATPLCKPIAHQHVAVCVFFVLLIALLNLRGLKESGTVFAIPTYFFVGMAVLMIALGFGGHLIGYQVHPDAAAPLPPNAPAGLVGTLAPLALLTIVLRAFANGCSAMTGTEAVSNGIPAFRAPESKNAAVTLAMMAVILGTLFLGISGLAVRYHIVYLHGSPAVIDQLSSVVFGKYGVWWRQALYYCMQFSTMAVLVLAANTSFADFPRLSAILARDRFLPRQLTNQGDKLVFGNGILLLAGCAIALLVEFHGNTDKLIPLYALGVFTAFTLSQSGMVNHWRKLRGPRWLLKACINGLGAICTAAVVIVVAVEKVPEGAWVVLVAAAILISAFWAIYRHYEFVRSRLTIVGHTRSRTSLSNTVLLLVPSLHRGIFPALEYATGMSSDCRAIHVNIDPADATRLMKEWEQHVGEDIPLVILPSPYRSLIGPILVYLDQVRKERENHVVTVILPEFVPGKWWHSVLHNSNAFLLKYYIGRRHGIVLTNFRYFLAADDAGSDGEEE